MERHTVASVSDVVPGRCRVLSAGGVEIGLFAVGGGYRAYRNLCPHAGAPICRGEVTEAGAKHERPSLRCPWHAWEFDLETGENLENPGYRLESFLVEVIAGKLVVTI